MEARLRPVAAVRAPRATVKALFNLGSSVVHREIGGGGVDIVMVLDGMCPWPPHLY